MKKLQIFDPALCCSTGVCGTEIDQSLVNFSADVDWLKHSGGQIERFNLAQQPMDFVNNAVAKAFLERSGVLPLIVVDGEIVLAGRYPTRDELARFAGLSSASADTTIFDVKACCSGSKCC
ncbi:MAG TPA: arsenical resistance operon transcriptional repressor ArsD [Gallionella sp.]|nr:MAG: transcriptional regulator [Gallionellales bacterium GWA2_54_124]OGT19485.1 MAG: transcriptional regulator [Gallionellales bacterium RIFOXYD12_FULL_53_10]OGT41670.1 MAG: transcriptional regulator [Gallionellales bacterium RIFOXYD2_FULL_52_7]HCI51735.1 arsenical resistance operon transcriptional repressor ArsD [Gallionella sp.]